MTDLSPAVLDRARLYVLIDGLEGDLRDLIKEWIAPFQEAEAMLGPQFAEASKRADPEMFEAGGSLVEFLYLSEAFAILNRHRQLLPDDAADSVRALTPRLDAIVPLRNRIMHGRPLEPADPEIAAALCSDLASSPIRWPRVDAILRQVLGNPDWTPIVPSTPRPSTGVLENLPAPDFDATGWIGRREETKQLLGMLLKRRPFVVTVIGEGGIGKTALAVKTLYELVDHPECPYDAVLWTTLKTEVLSASGVTELADTVQGLTGIATALRTPLDDSVESSLEELAASLEGIDALLAIDNLETADADEIVRLVEALPDSVNFLFTSRVGLGQLERRVPLGPLRPAEAVKMFRKLARHRGLDHLARLEQDACLEQVEPLRYSPLGIRWYVEAIDAGAQPEDLLGNQEALLRYCLESIFHNLSDEAQHLLQVLFVLDSPAGVAELALLADAPADTLRSAVHELQRRSFVEVSAGAAGALQQYSLASAAREYLRHIEPVPSEVASRIRERLASFRRSEEHRKTQLAKNYFDPAAIATTTEAERPAAFFLMRALRHSKAGELHEANALLDQAEELAPAFFEVKRVRGFINSKTAPAAAERSYLEALDLAPAEYCPKVEYFFAGHVMNELKDAHRAVDYAERAHAARGEPETALRLARVRMYLCEFDVARRLLEPLLSDDTRIRTRIIAQTELVHVTERAMQEMCAAQRNPVAGVRLGSQTVLRVWEQIQEAGFVDIRLQKAAAKLAAETLRVASSVGDLALVESDVIALAGAAATRRLDFAGISQDTWWVTNCLRLLRRPDCSPNLAGALESSQTAMEADRTPSGTARGRVFSLNFEKGYGFIDVEGSSLRAYARLTEAVGGRRGALLLSPGLPVTFELTEGERGLVATKVQPVDQADAMDAAGERIVRVSRLDSGHLFAEDAESHLQVFIHSTHFANSTEWEGVRTDDELNVRLDVSTEPRDNARAAAVPGSVVLHARHEPRTPEQWREIMRSWSGPEFAARVSLQSTCRARYADAFGTDPDGTASALLAAINTSGNYTAERPDWVPDRPGRHEPLGYLVIDDGAIPLIDGSEVRPALAARPLAAITFYPRAG